MELSKRGFTLIEILLSLLLFSGLLTLTYAAYDNLLSNKKTSQDRNHQASQEAFAMFRLTESLQRTTDYYVTQKDRPRLLFIGDEERMLLVSRRSIMGSDVTTLFMLQIENSSDAGLYDLNVYQYDLSKFQLLTMEQLPVAENMDKYQLLPAKKKLTFRYLVASLQNLVENDGEDFFQKLAWVDAYDASSENLKPFKVAIEVTDGSDDESTTYIFPLLIHNFQKQSFMGQQ